LLSLFSSFPWIDRTRCPDTLERFAGPEKIEKSSVKNPRPHPTTAPRVYKTRYTPTTDVNARAPSLRGGRGFFKDYFRVRGSGASDERMT